MELIIVKDYSELSVLGADFVVKQIEEKPDSVLGLATGSTPLGLYQYLIKLNKEKKISFKKVKSFNLDEYYGLSPNDPQSYRYFMDKNLFSQLDIDLKNTHVPGGLIPKKDIDKSCREYDSLILKAGGIDLQILGIGDNGHIGFNEPGSPLNSKTRLVKLTPETIKANSRFFKNKNEVPKEAISMGLATIFCAKKIVLLASGKDKAKAIKKLFESRPTPNLPASILVNHFDATVIADKQAASLL